MRVTVEISDDLLAALMSWHHDSTEAEAVELAIRAYLQTRASEGLRRLAGHLEIEDVSQDLRRVDRGSGRHT